MSERSKRLRTVLRVRAIQEEQRRGDLARAASAQAQAAAAVAGAAARYANRPAGTDHPTDLSTFLASRELELWRADGVTSTESEHALAEGETERSRGRLTEARTRTSGLERLLERAAEAHRLELLDADDAAAEESGRAREGER